MNRSPCNGHVAADPSEETSAEAESDSNEERRTSESSLSLSPEPEGVAAKEKGGASPKEPHLPTASGANGKAAAVKNGDVFRGDASVSMDTDDDSCNDGTLAQQERAYKALL